MGTASGPHTWPASLPLLPWEVYRPPRDGHSRAIFARVPVAQGNAVATQSHTPTIGLRI